MERIVEAVNALREGNDYLFTTGGIGPTHDDITVDAVAQALGVNVVVHPQARSMHLPERWKAAPPSCRKRWGAGHPKAKSQTSSGRSRRRMNIARSAAILSSA